MYFVGEYKGLEEKYKMTGSELYEALEKGTTARAG